MKKFGLILAIAAIAGAAQAKDNVQKLLDGKNTGIGGTNDHNGGLAAGDSYSNTQSATIPTSMAPGNYYLLVLIDGQGHVTETNEGNNYYAIPITITKSDLVPTALSGPATAYAGETISLSWTAQNQGSGPPNSSFWRDYLFLGRN